MTTKRLPMLLVGLPAADYGLTLHMVLACASSRWNPCPGMDDLELRYVDGEFRLRYAPGRKAAYRFRRHPDVAFSDPNWPNPDRPLALPECGPDPEELSMDLVENGPALMLGKSGWVDAYGNGMALAAFLSLEGRDDPRFSVALDSWFGNRDCYSCWHP